jgi:hypothetical protein
VTKTKQDGTTEIDENRVMHSGYGPFCNSYIKRCSRTELYGSLDLAYDFLKQQNPEIDTFKYLAYCCDAEQLWLELRKQSPFAAGMCLCCAQNKVEVLENVLSVAADSNAHISPTQGACVCAYPLSHCSRCLLCFGSIRFRTTQADQLDPPVGEWGASVVSGSSVTGRPIFRVHNEKTVLAFDHNLNMGTVEIGEPGVIQPKKQRAHESLTSFMRTVMMTNSKAPQKTRPATISTSR